MKKSISLQHLSYGKGKDRHTYRVEKREGAKTRIF